ELAPLSHNLSVLGALGIQALDALDSGRAVQSSVRNQQLAAVDDCARPHAEMLIPVVPAIRELVQAEPSVQ
ncbi:MAG TPA: hypothetical protein VH088_02585, partial [Terriglobales bacterium]|nr:hypothetical protein [Terriglobales bacterium]